MNLSWIHGVQSGADRSLRARLLRGCLWVLSLAYGFVVLCRKLAYETGWLRSRRLPAFVVSVGNITTGGTGKTPLVGWVVQALHELLLSEKPDNQAQIAILSRGYGATQAGSNDEKAVLDRICPGVPHLQNRQRARIAAEWLASLLPDQTLKRPAIVLDDGMQHRQLARDVELVVIDATHPFGYGYLLPRGMLREPLSQLMRADWFLVTRSEMVSQQQLSSLREKLLKFVPEDRILEVEFRPSRLINIQGETRSLSDLESVAYLPFCGIGNPTGFVQLLKHWLPAASVQMKGTLQIFDDHHHYTPPDLDELGLLANAHGARWLLTTMKDLVKIPQASSHGVEFWAVEIAPHFREGDERLRQHLKDRYESLNRSLVD